MDAGIFPSEVSSIISGVVIYLCAFSLLFRSGIRKFFAREPKKAAGKGKEADA